MIQVDIGGHPPIPFGPAPSILADFHIQHNLLFLAGFRVLHSRSCFGALMIQVDIGTPWIDLSNELLSASNGDQMPKLHPREVEPPIYPNGRPQF